MLISKEFFGGLKNCDSGDTDSGKTKRVFQGRAREVY